MIQSHGASPLGLGSAPDVVRVLLVDDQALIGEAVRRMLVDERDLEFRFCQDPNQAIAAAEAFSPTVILQDLVMPAVDGLTMLQRYRAHAATQSIPIIVLSAKEEAAVKAQAFQLGASDYLVKLPDPVELKARLRLHSAGYVARLQRSAAFAALERSEGRLAAELAEAARYLVTMFPERRRAGPATDWAFVPSAELGGDTFGYAWLDDDHFAMYLIDVCGHGLKAALLSISALNVLRNRTLPSADFTSPASVLGGMNDAFQMERHDGMYLTLWYGVFDTRRRVLKYASAGHPPALFLGGPDSSAAGLTSLPARGLVIGALEGTSYQEHQVDVPAWARLWVFSDGIYEVIRPDGVLTTYGDFTRLVEGAPRDGNTLEHLMRAVKELRGSAAFDDDVSIFEVTF